MTLHLSEYFLRFAIVGAAMAMTVGSGSAFDEPGAGTIVPQGEMPEFCQNAVAARYEVSLDAITTDPPVEREGKIMVLGTVDGENHDLGINCRFEPNGAFIDVIEAPAMSD